MPKANAVARVMQHAGGQGEDEATARPFVKWVGGKRQLLPQIRKYVPNFTGTYFEPFVGGGALFFDLRPRTAVLADRNQRLVRAYSGIRNDVESVITRLGSFELSKEQYLQLRQLKVDECAEDSEVSAWFIYLNKMGFNGLYRVNSRNEFNVPYGRHRNPNVCDAPTLRACSLVLRRAKVTCADFERVVEKAKAGDFVYFDPPYVPLSASSNFTSYTAGGFGPAEQQRLRDVALRLKRRGVGVLLSNSDAKVVRELYKGFEIIEVKATRLVNSKATGRGEITELLIR